MSKTRRIVRTSDDLVALYADLGNRPRPFTVTVEKGEKRDRTLSQNALQFKWATEVARQRGDVEPIDVQHEWKLSIGVPILREEDASFNKYCGFALDVFPYEYQLKAMKFLAISSIMTTKQMTRFMDAIERTCRAEGFRLTNPEREQA